jgi:hypothetical protein
MNPWLCMPPENSLGWEKWDMLTGAAPVMKAAPQGALCVMGFGCEAMAQGGCLLPDMPPAGAGSGRMGSLGVTGSGSGQRRFAGPKRVFT